MTRDRVKNGDAGRGLGGGRDSRHASISRFVSIRRLVRRCRLSGWMERAQLERGSIAAAQVEARNMSQECDTQQPCAIPGVSGLRLVFEFRPVGATSILRSITQGSAALLPGLSNYAPLGAEIDRCAIGRRSLRWEALQTLEPVRTIGRYLPQSPLLNGAKSRRPLGDTDEAPYPDRFSWSERGVAIRCREQSSCGRIPPSSIPSRSLADFSEF